MIESGMILKIKDLDIKQSDGWQMVVVHRQTQQALLVQRLDGQEVAVIETRNILDEFMK